MVVYCILLLGVLATFLARIAFNEIGWNGVCILFFFLDHCIIDNHPYTQLLGIDNKQLDKINAEIHDKRSLYRSIDYCFESPEQEKTPVQNNPLPYIARCN